MDFKTMIHNLYSDIYRFVYKQLFKRCCSCWWRTYNDCDCGSFFNVCSICYPKYWKNRMNDIYFKQN